MTESRDPFATSVGARYDPAMNRTASATNQSVYPRRPWRISSVLLLVFVGVAAAISSAAWRGERDANARRGRSVPRHLHTVRVARLRR